MPYATQFFMEAKLTFILGLPFILLTIPEVLMSPFVIVLVAIEMGDCYDMHAEICAFM